MCKINGCINKNYSLDLCSRHYTRFRRYGCYDKPKCNSEKLLVNNKAQCHICKKIKNIKEFNKDNQTISGYARACRDCQKIKSNNRYKNFKLEHKNNHLKSYFNISLNDYNKILKKQNGVCAICGLLESRKTVNTSYTLAIDHDHITGKVRGLLCHRCNLGLGQFKDTTVLLQKAIEYLKGTING